MSSFSLFYYDGAGPVRGIAEWAQGHKIIDAFNLQPIPCPTQAKAAKAIVRAFGLKERLGDDKSQPSAGLEIPIGNGIEHQHGEVFFAAAVLTVTSISANTLTIAAGGKVVIDSIAGGPLSGKITPVPEPSTLVILAGAFILLLRLWPLPVVLRQPMLNPQQ